MKFYVIFFAALFVGTLVESKKSSIADAALKKLNKIVVPVIKNASRQMDEVFKKDSVKVKGRLEEQTAKLEKMLKKMGKALKTAGKSVSSNLSQNEVASKLDDVRSLLEQLQKTNFKADSAVSSFFPSFQKNLQMLEEKNVDLRKGFEESMAKGNACQRKQYFEFDKIKKTYESDFAKCAESNMYSIDEALANFNLFLKNVTEQSKQQLSAVPKKQSIMKKMLTFFKDKPKLNGAVLVNTIDSSIKNWEKSLESVRKGPLSNLNKSVSAASKCYTTAHQKFLKDWTKQSITFENC